MPKHRYRSIDMRGRFVLEVLTAAGDWIDWGLYDADDFVRGEDGAYLCQGEGSPLWLRCRRQDGNILYVVDGGGDPYVYRMVPFPGARDSPSEGK